MKTAPATKSFRFNRGILATGIAIVVAILGIGIGMFETYREDTRLEKTYGSRTYEPTTMTIAVKWKHKEDPDYSASGSFNTTYDRCMESQRAASEGTTITCKPTAQPTNKDQPHPH